MTFLPCHPGELVHGVNQQWLVVDRIVAVRGAALPSTSSAPAAQPEYLVKWKELGYDMCRCVSVGLDIVWFDGERKGVAATLWSVVYVSVRVCLEGATCLFFHGCIADGQPACLSA
jgi:hypothetical protein